MQRIVLGSVVCVFTGHHFEGQGQHASSLATVSNRVGVWVATLGTHAWLWIAGGAWFATYFSLSSNPPDPTAEEIARFTRSSLIGTAIFVVALATAVGIGRGNGASWLRSFGLAAQGLFYGLGSVIVFFYVFSQ